MQISIYCATVLFQRKRKLKTLETCISIQRHQKIIPIPATLNDQPYAEPSKLSFWILLSQISKECENIWQARGMH